jgi:hypothetical protein
MRFEDCIILCVEDTSDWKHGCTREVVLKADLHLSRTVIVNTKIPQFGMCRMWKIFESWDHGQAMSYVPIN